MFFVLSKLFWFFVQPLNLAIFLLAAALLGLLSGRRRPAGFAATLDGVACNVGKADGCKIHTLAKRPMTEVAPRADVRATIAKELEEVVVPGWLKRCGDKCNKVYAEVIAPVTGMKARK